MKLEPVAQIANAVLYEGYNLYPYRPSSVKNRQRWTFGGVCPQTFAATETGERCAIQTQCLVLGPPQTLLDIQARFLHLLQRKVGEFVGPDSRCPLPYPIRPIRYVDALRSGDRIFQAWEEAVEREVSLPRLLLGSLLDRPRQTAFAFPGWSGIEPLQGPNGAEVGVFERTQQPLNGVVEVGAEQLECPADLKETGGSDLYRLTVRVTNLTPFAGDVRAQAMLHSLVSTHVILGVDGVARGEFVSAIDPPQALCEESRACRQEGLWPVLVGEAPDRTAMLAAPIILYDYPEIAPESPGDLFDGTEIDEILTLRILTLTEEERQAMRGADARTRALLDRTDTLPPEQLAKLHGALRGLRAEG